MLKKFIILLIIIGSSSSLFAMRRTKNPHAFANPQHVPINNKKTEGRNKRAENTTRAKKKRKQECCECITMIVPAFICGFAGGCYALQEDAINAKEVGSMVAVGSAGGAIIGYCAYSLFKKEN